MPGDHNGSRWGLGKYIRIGELPPEDSPVAAENPPRETLKGYRFSELIKGNGWRPLTLRPPTLFLLLVSTIGLIAIIEALNHISTRYGALTFEDPHRGFSTAQIFCYRYLPQIIIVSYGVGWAAVDLDVKRLEPYFQLSKPGGASAISSILLHYPFDFLALVPVAAAKKKHWNVFAAGTALVLITWVITPLQSSLLTIEPVGASIPTRFALTGKLEPYSSQAGDFGSSSFFCSSYGVTWLGERVPEFMNNELIAMPFNPVRDGYGEKRDNELWIVVTRVYQTHISCAPATIIEPGKNDNGAYNFTTDNCSFSFNPLPDETATSNLVYIGYGNNNSEARWNLHESDCKVKSIFLGVWARSRLQPNGTKDIDVSGIFCHTKYSYANASITIDTFDNSIKVFNLIGERKPLAAEDRIIDIDSFEQCLGNGRTRESVEDDRLPALAPATTVRYEDWNLSDPTWQVGYAIGLEKKKFDDFRDPEVFGEAMNKTHKLLFNYAVREIRNTRNESELSDSDFVNGTAVVRRKGIVVVPEVAHLLAGFLSAVALCVAGVIFLSCHRRNDLHSDPDSLATAMSLVSQSPQLLRDFEGTDNCPKISRCIKRRRYKLGPWGGEDGHRLDIVDAEDVTTSEGPGSDGSCSKPHDGRGIWPWELSVGIGAGTTIFSAGLLMFLAFLFRSSHKYSGLPTFSNHELVVRFIYSFMPTMAATIIEPVWVIITRYLALYQPWTELNRGHSSSAASLGLKYSNLPPVLIAPRALVGRHYILCLASAVVLASNGLAVALGGIFDSGLRSTNTTTTFKLPLSASIDTQIQTKGVGNKSILANVTGTFAKDGEEHWLIANTNFQRGTLLPPWVAPGLYFLPFENTTVGGLQDFGSAKTWGVGVNLTCELLEGGLYEQQSWAGVSGGPNPKLAVALNVTVPMENGDAIRCGNPLAEFKAESLKSGIFAGEYLFGLGPIDRGGKEAEDFCNSLLVVGWNRGSIRVRRPSNSTATVGYTMNMHTYANTTVLCRQKISSAEFNVVVDNRGRVQEFERLTPFTYDNSSLFSSSTTIASFKAQLSTIVRTNPYSGRDTGQMHNGRSCRTFPHFVVNRTAPVSICDPQRPPPSLEDVHQGLQSFYSWFSTIVIGQNSKRIFRSTANDRGEMPEMAGRRISFQNRVSMDPVLFYIAASLLGFSAVASVVTFTTRPKPFLPRLPNTLAAEIGFFYASEAVEDVAGTAHMTSAMRERHLAKLGWEYGYGKFVGRDGKVHLGVERMGPIDDFNEISGTLDFGTAAAGGGKEKF